VTEALFSAQDGRWLPSAVAVGPWDPGALHGGPVAALLARALETLPAAGPMRTTRVAVEILRPVPVAPLELRAEVVRDGRRVQYAEATLLHDGAELCRASAWRVRRSETAVAPEPVPEPPPQQPEDVERSAWRGEGDQGFVSVTEHRYASGGWEVGPADVWFRLGTPLVAGEDVTPLQRAMALGDFGNGVSAAVSWDTHTFVNTDLTVYLDRDPAGEWLLLRARTRLDPSGSGVAESELFDTTGRVGRALQSLYVDERP
jgi:acyl-CoA thioesterase